MGHGYKDYLLVFGGPRDWFVFGRPRDWFVFGRPLDWLVFGRPRDRFLSRLFPAGRQTRVELKSKKICFHDETILLAGTLTTRLSV
jgi:hypothetical protein